MIIAYKTDPINYINLGIIPLAEAAISMPLEVIAYPTELGLQAPMMCFL